MTGHPDCGGRERSERGTQLASLIILDNPATFLRGDAGKLDRLIPSHFIRRAE